MLLDLLDPDLRIVLLTARPGAGAPPHRGVAAPLRDPLGPAHHAAVGRLRAVPATSSRRRSWELRRYGFELRARLRGRPPQRRDVPRRGHPVPLLPLRLLRLTERPSGTCVGRIARTVERTVGSLLGAPYEVNSDARNASRPPSCSRVSAPSSWASGRSSAADRAGHRARSRPRCSSAAPTGSATSSRSRRRGPKPVTARGAARRSTRSSRTSPSAADMPMPTIYVSPDERSRTRSPPAATRTTPRSCVTQGILQVARPTTSCAACSPTSSRTCSNRDILIGSVAAAVAIGDHVRRPDSPFWGALFGGGGGDDDGGNAFGVLADGDPRSDRGGAAAGGALALA